MHRLFVIEHCNFKLEPLKIYGSFEYVFESIGDRTSIWAEDFSEVVLDELQAKGFDPTQDFIVASGAIATLCISIAAIAGYYGCIKLLLYQSTVQGYVPRIIDYTGGLK